MSSRTAVCGQPPVSTAAMRSGASASLPHQELRVLLREDVVGDDRDGVAIAEPPAERQQQRGLAAANRSANPDGEGPPPIVAPQRRRTFAEGAGTLRELGLVHRGRTDGDGTGGEARRAPSGLEEPRIQAIVRRLQQVDDRCGLREVALVEVTRAIERPRRLPGSSRAGSAATRSCRQFRAAPRPPARRAPPYTGTPAAATAVAASARRTPRPITGPDGRGRRPRARQRRRRADGQTAPPSPPAPAPAHGSRGSPRDWSETRRPADRARRISRDRDGRHYSSGSMPQPVCSRTAAAKASSAAAFGISRCCQAASSPPECAKPPVGKAESASCQASEIRHVRTGSNAAPAAALTAGCDRSGSPSAVTTYVSGVDGDCAAARRSASCRAW